MFSTRYLPCDDAVQCRTSSAYSVLFVSESLGVFVCVCYSVCVFFLYLVGSTFSLGNLKKIQKQ